MLPAEFGIGCLLLLCLVTNPKMVAGLAGIGVLQASDGWLQGVLDVPVLLGGRCPACVSIACHLLSLMGRLGDTGSDRGSKHTHRGEFREGGI